MTLNEAPLWKTSRTNFLPYKPPFYLGALPYTLSTCALTLAQEDTVHGSSEICPSRSSWQFAILYTYLQGANDKYTIYSRKLSKAKLLLWIIGFGMDKVGWTDKVLLTVMNLFFPSFTRETSFRKGSLISSCTVKAVQQSSMITKAGPKAKPAGYLTETKSSEVYKGWGHSFTGNCKNKPHPSGRKHAWKGLCNLGYIFIFECFACKE